MYHPGPFIISNLKKNSSPIVLIEIPTIVLKEGRSERGYNPGTPSNFWNNLKVIPLDDTPTEARIGGACHLLWLHPHDRHQEAVVLTGPALRKHWVRTQRSQLEPWLVSVGDNTRTRLMTSVYGKPMRSLGKAYVKG